MYSLQWADPDIQAAWTLLRQKTRPGLSVRQSLSTPALALLRHRDRLVERDGVLHRRTLRPKGGEEVFQVILPASLKRDVLTQLHQDHGHQGVERTTELVCQRCFWPGMAAEVKRWCQECERCQVAKNTNSAVPSFMGHLLASQLNEILAMDFTILEPSHDGLENVLVMTDIFSKFTAAIPTRDQRASTVAQVLVTQWFCKFGGPIVSILIKVAVLRAALFSNCAVCMELQGHTLHLIILLVMDNVSALGLCIICCALYLSQERETWPPVFLS